jgi:hypothetical protein
LACASLESWYGAQKEAAAIAIPVTPIKTPAILNAQKACFLTFPPNFCQFYNFIKFFRKIISPTIQCLLELGAVVIIKNIKTGNGLKMKTKLKVVTFYLLAVVLGGCAPPVQSVYPLFSENELIFDPNLLGFWKATDSNTTGQFSQIEDQNACKINAYKLIITENDGNQGNFLAGLGELQGNLFLEIYPDTSHTYNNQESGFHKQHLLGMYSFMRIEQIDPNLKVALMDYEKVSKIIEADPNVIGHEFANDKLILTASTKELQEFVVKYGINVDDANSVFSELGGEFIWVAEDANDITTPREAEKP